MTERGHVNGTTCRAGYMRHGDCGVILMDNPPVNVLTSEVIEALEDAFKDFRADVDAVALVIGGKGRSFCAGGDIVGLGVQSFSPRPLNTLLASIEASDRPVVAALHGDVLGGGLELAMACHHRVALEGTRLGLPEVKLGLVPGSLGTQRLPRLVGVSSALNLMLNSRLLGAQEARNAGLVDLVINADVLQAALQSARTLAGTELRRTSALPVGASEPGVFERALEVRHHAYASAARNGVVRCVRAAVETTFVEGERIEAETFEALRQSPVSKALRHLFIAEREAARIPNLRPELALQSIQRVAVVGAGTMGVGIAMCFVNAGIITVLVEVRREALERGMEQIRRHYESAVAKGRLHPIQLQERMSRLEGSLDDASLSQCDLVIEAVFEDLRLKKQICERIGAIAKPGAIIATNTSTLDVNVLAHATGRPADFVGMHFFSPAHVMRLLEVVRGEATSENVLASVMALAPRLGKVPVVSGVCYGFIGNRMAEVYMREAEFLLMEGAQPGQIDSAAEAIGMAMGPCRMLDMAGIDVGARTVIEYGKAGGLPPDPSYRAVVRKLFELGRFGQKSGAGYYRYEGRTPIADPEVAVIARSLGAEHGIPAREDVPDSEIVERLLYPLINEGVRILDEGIAYRPGDIDVVWVAGYGFPAERGGPMFMADEIGMSVISQRLAHYAALRGSAFGYWEPAPLLARLAADGQALSAFFSC